MKTETLKGTSIHSRDIKLTFPLTKALTKELLKGARLKRNEIGLAECSIRYGKIEVIAVAGGNVPYKGRASIKSRTLLNQLDKIAIIRVKAYIKLLQANGINVIDAPSL